jgi:hypothetical protein
VNVFLGADATSVKVAPSYFLVTDGWEDAPVAVPK